MIQILVIIYNAASSFLKEFYGFLLYCLDEDNTVSLDFIFRKSKSSLDNISKLRLFYKKLQNALNSWHT